MTKQRSRGMIYGYARVSTRNQNLNLQLDSLKKYGCDKIFCEKKTGDSRKNKDREQLSKLLSVIKKGDTLVVHKLDRLSRTLVQIINLLDYFSKNGILFVSISDNFDTSTAYGKAFLNLAAVFAQLEVDLNSERTLEGLESARQRGHFGGRPSIPKSTQAKMYQMYYSGEYPVDEICYQCNITSPTLYKYINLFKNEPDQVPVTENINNRRKTQSGRPPLNNKVISELQRLYNEDGLSISDIVKLTGISRTTVIKYCLQNDKKE